LEERTQSLAILKIESHGRALHFLAANHDLAISAAVPVIWFAQQATLFYTADSLYRGIEVALKESLNE
jgi:hypothetical protein